jgi:2-hydroxycyclohexanecarboxyl-CoA dehydrogenase
VETGLAGRTVVVTGATANIGRGIALGFAAERCNVVVVGRDEVQGRKVCLLAKQLGAKDTLWWAADVTDRTQVLAMVAAVRDRFGAIDVLLNNVGGNVDLDRFVDSDPATWERDMALTFVSTLNCTHAVLPAMIERSHGRIINIGSTSGIVGDTNMAVYSAMKGAVHTFTKVLAKEVGKHGITVNAIAPYGTLPEDPEHDVSSGSRFHSDGLFALLLATKGELMGEIARKTVLERQFARPADVAGAAVYLASEAAEFVTGQVLRVDGGTVIA